MKKRSVVMIFAILIVLTAAGVFAGLAVRNSQTFLINFDTGASGIAISSQTVKYGDKVTEPEEPFFENYRFKGWYKDPLRSVLYDFSAQVKADMNLYAVFTRTFKIEFETFCEEIVETQFVDEGTRAQMPIPPQRKGYAFYGWFLDESINDIPENSGYKHSAFSDEIDVGTDLNADAAKSVMAADTLTASEQPQEYFFNEAVVADLTLYAKWKRIYYTLTFDSRGGESIDEQSVLLGELPVRPQSPRKSGERFVDWFLDDDCTVRFDFSLPLSEDLTVYALWLALPRDTAILTYYVFYPKIYAEYFVEIGRLPTRPADPYYTADGLLISGDKKENNPAHSAFYGYGYRIRGWYTDESLTNSFDFDAPLEEDIRVFAALQLLRQINFVDGERTFTIYAFDGDMVQRPADPQRADHEFTGWYANSARTETYNFSKVVSGNMNIYAGWEGESSEPKPDPEPDPDEEKHLYTFILYGETIYIAGEVGDGNTVEKPENPHLSGSVFVGWFEDNAGTTPFDFAAPVHKNVSIYAKWQSSSGTFTITFEDWIGDTLLTVWANAGENITPPTAPKRTYYTFAGWSNQSELSGVLSDVTCRAEYEYHGTDSDGFVYEKYGEDGYLIIGVTTREDRLFLPITYDGKPVRGIKDGDKSIFSGVTFVFVPHGYEVIGARAFSDCVSLTTVEIESRTLSKIGKYAFAGTGISRLVLPESKVAVFVGEYAFYGCAKLCFIDLGSAVAIGEYAFFRAGNGDSVTLIIGEQSKITSIGQYVFAYVHIMGELSLLHCTEIGKSAFYYSEFSAINLPVIEVVGDSAFYPKNAPENPDIFLDLSGICHIRPVFLGESLREVGSYSFLCAEINSLPKNIKRISVGAFINSVFGSVNIGSGLEKLGDSAFAYARIGSLLYAATIDLPTSVFYKATLGGANAYVYNNESTSGVTHNRGANSFENNAALGDIILSGGFRKIGDFAFFGCVLDYLTLPTTVREIGEQAFRGCTASELVLSSALTDFGALAFSEMMNLTAITIPNGINEIGANMFLGCESLYSVVFEGEVGAIEAGAFRGTAISEFVLPIGLTRLGAGAFSLSKLAVLTLSPMLTVFDMQSVEDTPLETIYILGNHSRLEILNGEYAPAQFAGFVVEGDSEYFSSVGGDLYTADGKRLLYFVDKQSFESPAELEEIADFQFYGASKLRVVTIGEQVKRIGAYAFAGGVGIVSVDFSEAVLLESIGKGAFSGSGVLEVDLSACGQLWEIPEDCFFDCALLNSIILPSGGNLSRIGERAFSFERSAAGNLTILDFGRVTTLKTIADGAFENRAGLAAVVLPSSIKYLGGFKYCSGLNSLTFMDGGAPEKVGAYAFYGCESLTAFQYTSGLVMIGEYAFAGSGLTNFSASALLEMGAGAFLETSSMVAANLEDCPLLCIPKYAFYGSALAELVLPKSLLMVDEFAFSRTKLVSIDISSTVSVIYAGAFSFCDRLETVWIGSVVGGSALELFGTMPFEGCVNLKNIYLYAIMPPSVHAARGGIANMGQAVGLDPINALKIYVPASSLSSYLTATNNPFYDIQQEQSWQFHITQLYAI